MNFASFAAFRQQRHPGNVIGQMGTASVRAHSPIHTPGRVVTLAPTRASRPTYTALKHFDTAGRRRKGVFVRGIHGPIQARFAKTV